MAFSWTSRRQHLATFSSLLPRNKGATASQRLARKVEVERTSVFCAG